MNIKTLHSLPSCAFTLKQPISETMQALRCIVCAQRENWLIGVRKICNLRSNNFPSIKKKISENRKSFFVHDELHSSLQHVRFFVATKSAGRPLMKRADLLKHGAFIKGIPDLATAHDLHYSAASTWKIEQANGESPMLLWEIYILQLTIYRYLCVGVTMHELGLKGTYMWDVVAKDSKYLYMAVCALKF